MSYKSIPILMPQTYTLDQIIQIRTENFTDRRTLTQSHDEAIQLVNLGGDGSYIIIYDLDLWPVENQNQLLALPHELRYLSPKMVYRPCLTQNVTQAFNINPENYPMWQPPGHMGIDLGVYAGDPYYATQKGVVKHASNKMWSSNQPSAYGYNVVIDHGGYHTLYAHAKSNLPVSVGDIVQAGQIVGYSGNTGASDGYHLHYSVLVNYDTGYHKTVWGWFTDPTYVISLPAPSVPPTGNIDVGSFMKADPTAFRVVRHSSGSGEDIQDLDLGNGNWVRRKNQNGEWWRLDATHAYLIHDTSPSPDSQGNERVYTLTTNGQLGSKKNPIKMNLNQTWTEPTSHWVQFRAKADCRDLSENSGSATNYAVLIDHKFNYTFNTYGQNLTLDEVIWLKTSHDEIQVYAKHQGKVVSWCGWQAPWGSSEITELYWDRGIMTTEPNRYCKYVSSVSV